MEEIETDLEGNDDLQKIVRQVTDLKSALKSSFANEDVDILGGIQYEGKIEERNKQLEVAYGRQIKAVLKKNMEIEALKSQINSMNIKMGKILEENKKVNNAKFDKNLNTETKTVISENNLKYYKESLEELLSRVKERDRVISEKQNRIQALEKMVQQKQNLLSETLELLNKAKEKDKIIIEKQNKIKVLEKVVEDVKSNSSKTLEHLNKVKEKDNIIAEKQNKINTLEKVIEDIRRNASKRDISERDLNHYKESLDELLNRVKERDKIISEKQNKIKELEKSRGEETELVNKAKRKQNKLEDLEKKMKLRDKFIRELLMKRKEDLLKGNVIDNKMDTLEESRDEKKIPPEINVSKLVFEVKREITESEAIQDLSNIVREKEDIILENQNKIAELEKMFEENKFVSRETYDEIKGALEKKDDLIKELSIKASLSGQKKKEIKELIVKKVAIAKEKDDQITKITKMLDEKDQMIQDLIKKLPDTSSDVSEENKQVKNSTDTFVNQMEMENTEVKIPETFSDASADTNNKKRKYWYELLNDEKRNKTEEEHNSDSEGIVDRSDSRIAENVNDIEQSKPFKLIRKDVSEKVRENADANEIVMLD